uniref:Tetraspanin n=1 Tax=Onchocerca volvulus TaxID=6282 RepID=A0A8R1TJL0_ONCVO
MYRRGPGYGLASSVRPCSASSLVGGLNLIIAGAVVELKYTGLLDILGDEKFATPILLIAAGALCSLLGFLGCCGAIRENYCLTVSFAVLLTLVLTLETAIAIAAYALQEPLQTTLSRQLTLGLQRYNHSAGVRMAWDQTQKQFACCGVHNYTDWNIPPDSCCIQILPQCRLIEQNLQSSGCMERLEHWLILNATMIGGISAIIGSLQVIGICFACCLSKSILKDFNDSYY